MLGDTEDVVESEIVVEGANPEDYIMGHHHPVGEVLAGEEPQVEADNGTTVVISEDGLPVFAKRSPNFLEAADVVLTGTEDDTITCDVLPNHYHGNKCAFLLDLDKFRTPVKRISDLTMDAYGGWRAWGSKDMYFQETVAGDFVKIGGVGRRPPNSDWDLLVHEYRLFHPQRDPRGGDGKLTKRIYAIFSDAEYKEITGRWVLITYEWKGQPFDVTPLPRRGPTITPKTVVTPGPGGTQAPTDSFNDMPGLTPAYGMTPGDYPRDAMQLRQIARRAGVKPARQFATLPKRRKRAGGGGRASPILTDEDVEEDELLELERTKLEKEIEILEMQKSYLGLKMEREQRNYMEHQEQQQNFPHRVQFLQVATTD